MNHVQDLVKRAIAAHQAGRLDEAEAGYSEALTLAPADHNALANLGAVMLQRGHLPEGLELIDRALAVRPDQPNVLANKAGVLIAMGRLDDALAALQAGPSLDAGGVSVAVRIGDILREQGDNPRALAAYELAYRWAPDRLDILNAAAAALVGMRSFEPARAALEAVLAADPGHGPALFNLGVALHSLGRFEEAVASFERAREAGIDAALVDASLGNALRALGRHGEALVAYDRSLAVRDNAQAHIDRGIALLQLQRLDDCAEAMLRALALSPGDPFARSNLSMTHLARGRFAEGWALYEDRWKASMGHAFATLPRPLWFGDGPVAGKTMLVLAEQGLGDTLQFVRYVPWLAERGARVVLQVPPPLTDLCRSVAGVAEVVPDDRPPPPFDLCCPLMSLPFALGGNDIPVDAPYLQAPPDRVAAWAARMGPRRRKRVGLCWWSGAPRGIPEFWSAYSRNIPLEALAPLAQADVEFWSLQKGDGASQLARLAAEGWDGPPVIDASGDLQDFADTAALAENLDLVVTVDTSVPHLVGALGKPLWLMNRFDTCWRWQLDRADSDWYPTARIFRQRSFGDWGPVIEEVAEALRDFASG